MHWDEVKGNWALVKTQARQMWGDLTDEELDTIAGRREKLIDMLQTTYGYPMELAQSAVDNWVNRL